ncbi:MAG: hypothetical protein ACJAT2_000505 [Bacteriovoracaceae bacterium]
MNTLSKHKKKGLDGFKKFVCSLEGMSEATRLKVVQVAILEDPVYLMAALSNMVSFDYIFRYEGADAQKIYEAVPGGVQSLLFALYAHDKAEQFLSHLDEGTKLSYRDEKEYLKEPEAPQINTARNSFVKAMRALQQDFQIADFEWNLPSTSVINGEGFSSAESTGVFHLTYDTGIKALEGELEKKLRVGEWKHYYPNGAIMAEGFYVSSEKAGNWVFYYADGSVKSKGEYRENLREGQWEEYDRDGEMIHVIYKRGKPDV